MFARGRNLGFGCASATPVGEVCSADLEWDVRACGAVRADDGETTPAAEDQVAAVRRPVDRVHEPLREPPLVRAVRVHQVQRVEWADIASCQALRWGVEAAVVAR